MQPSIAHWRRSFRLSLAFAALMVASIGTAQAPRTFAVVPDGLSAADWSGIQQAYLKASNTDAWDNFGVSVAVSGDTVVVGADVEDSSATGVNGDQSDNSASGAGAAYVFVRVGTGWSQQAYLKASNAEGGDLFGASVAISGDTLVVGAWGEESNATGVDGDQSDNSLLRAGAAYVFVRSGTSWSQQAYLKASAPDEEDRFGVSVAVSGDTVVVGAHFEDSNATGVNGDPTNNDADRAGAAYVFARSGTTWSPQAYLKGSNTEEDDWLGWSVAASGDTVVVGAVSESSNATGVNGNQADNSASSSGAAYVFIRSGSSWSQQAYLKASNTDRLDQFGWSLAAADDTVAVGAPSEASSATGVNGDQSDNSASLAGAAYVFVRVGTGWSQQAYLKASNTEAGDFFGGSVAVSGDTVVVGAWREDSDAIGVSGDQGDNSAQWAGAAYAFVRNGTSWSQQAYLKASNTDAFDYFGWSVGASGETLVIGAQAEDSNAIGVNGNQADNSAAFAGAAYVFVLEEPDCLVLDFETEDDFVTPLVNGQDISTPPEFGSLVSISASTISKGPAIFDTDPFGPNQGPPFNDPDLLVDRGNVLIFQEVPGQTVPGIFDHPDDSSAGGTFFFDFTQPVEVRSLDLIDIDLYPPPQDAYVTLIDSSFKVRVYHAPSGWTEDITIDGGAGFRTLDTTTLADQPGFTATATASEDAGFDPTDVVRMEVSLTSSGAVDNIQICLETPDTSPRMYRTPFPVPLDRR